MMIIQALDAAGGMSGSVALSQPSSVLMSMTAVTIGGHVDAWSLDNHLGPCWSLETMLPPGPIKIWVAFTATRGHGDIWAQVAAEGHVWVCGPAAA